MNTADYEVKKQAYRRELHTFEEAQLFPAIGERLAEIFPDLDFRKNGPTWYSSKDVNGNETHKKGALYCTPSPTYPPRIMGNGSRGAAGDGIAVLDLYAQRHNLGGKAEAAEAIAALLGIAGFPKWEGYVKGDSSKADKIEADKIEAAKIFADRLAKATTAEAEEARAYLLQRFTEAEYKEALDKRLIGFADTTAIAQAEKLAPMWHAGKPLQSNIGKIHTIAIISPYGLHPADSFNFRALPSKEEEARAAGKEKYDMPVGTARDVLGGLEYGDTSVIVVEGEVDRLKATLAISAENKARKAENKPLLRAVRVVSAGTCEVSEKKAVEAVRKGAKRFTLLFDTDSPKEKVDELTGQSRPYFAHEMPAAVGIARTIERLYNAGAEEVYIAQLPQLMSEEGAALKADTADYIRAAGVIGWAQAVRESKRAAAVYLADCAIYRYIEEVGYYGADEERRDTMYKALTEVLLSKKATPDTAEKIYARLQQYEALGYGDNFRIKADSLRAYINGRKEEERRAERRLQIANSAEEANKAAIAGAYEKAAEIMEGIKGATAVADYSQIYALPASAELIEASLKEVVPGVSTGLYMHTVDDTKREVTIKEGVSLIVGARKHGKTTFLCNVAINEAKRNIEAYNSNPTAPMKKVLLITYEVRKERLIRDLLAIYSYGRYYGAKDVREALTKEAIAAFYDEGRKPEYYNEFCEAKAAFYRDYLQSGALTIIDLSGRKDVEDLVGLLTQYLSGEEAAGGVSLVALDYIQKLNTRDKAKAKASRPEALKYIGEVLTDFGIKNGLPILCAAQFNRINNLLQVDTVNIGEAGDLERNAVDVIGLFNLKELKALQGADYTTGFGLHKNIFRKFNIADESFIAEVPTGEYYTKDTNGHTAGEEKTRPNIKPIKDKLYISLMASRFGSYPAEVITDFVGASGFVDIEATDHIAADSVKRVALKEQAEEEARLNTWKRETSKGRPIGGADDEEEDGPF